MQDIFIEFHEMHEYARKKHSSAETEKDKAYWQGVKDGLRKLYGIININSRWDDISKSSNYIRPEGNIAEYVIQGLRPHDSGKE
ncbi:MAG: hypothetical protein KAJ07_04685 [Planctomycetes bacterium]|nr:hypothetical protein [Planctomycetota bacterium]